MVAILTCAWVACPMRGQAPKAISSFETSKPIATLTLRHGPPLINGFAPAAFSDPQKIHGQVCISTRGAGRYKVPGAWVRAYPAKLFPAAAQKQRRLYCENWCGRFYSASTAWASWRRSVRVESAITATQTDAEGNFELVVPAGSFFLICYHSRIAGGKLEESLWVAPVTAERVELNSYNEWEQEKSTKSLSAVRE